MWNHAVFSKNRDRLLNQEVAQQFFARVKAKAERLMSDEHLDVTLIEAWAKSQEPSSGRAPTTSRVVERAAIHGEKRTNDTHESQPGILT